MNRQFACRIADESFAVSDLRRAADFHQSADRIQWFRENGLEFRLVMATERDEIVAWAILETAGADWFLWKGPAGEPLPGALATLLAGFDDLPRVTLVMQPEWVDEDALSRARFSSAGPFETLLVPVHGTEEEMLGGMKLSARRGVSHAIRAGLQISESPEEIHRFYEVYSAAMIAAGSPDFATLAELTSLLKLPRVHLYLAFLGQEVVAGSVCFENADSLEARYVATDAAYRHLAPLHLVHFRTMQRAATLGLRYFDLSGIATGPLSSKLEGINRFKEGFGGERHAYPMFVRGAQEQAHEQSG